MKRRTDPLHGSSDPTLDPNAPASEAEIAAAERLRLALDRDDRALTHPHRGRSPEVELARALRAAYRPRALAPLRHQALLDAAVGPPPCARRGGNVVRFLWGPAGLVAAAAALFVVLHGRGEPRGDHAGASLPGLAVRRSAGALFTEPFAPTGGTSARIDRIAHARARDLRTNRFIQWGVR